MDQQPKHEEIYVISDLHMGGEVGFQILKETKRLAGFISWVAEQRPNESVALVLNGDVFDTLAENALQGYIAIDNAPKIIHRIMTDDSFVGIWRALADFVKRKNRTLICILGNHDLELAFPSVQRFIRDRLAGSDLAAWARIEFSTIGAGYNCLVGNTTIYCTHGNEVDEWNFTRYEDLSKAARRLSAGRSLGQSEWYPNAGTKMVRDIMNDVKLKYRWVDLLKPEMDAAVSVLTVLEPAVLGKLASVAALLTESKIEKAEADARLSGKSVSTARHSVSTVDVHSLLGPQLMEAINGNICVGAMSADAMLRQAEQNMSISHRTKRVTQDGTLGRWQYYVDRLSGVEPEEALRRAVIDWIKDDRSFMFDHHDETFERICNAVSPDIDVVITGHTHLARSISRGSGRHYFNSGTWIRLMQFTNEMLKDADSFRPVYRVLVKGDIESIDNPAQKEKSILLDRTCVVRISTSANGVIGQLLNVVGDGGSKPVPSGADEFRKS
ncbi:MAG TPA: metallophosphoesterase [Nitrospira sp.]|nr:metallophosphoesterase [Nitrospira sp.]